MKEKNLNMDYPILDDEKLSGITGGIANPANQLTPINLKKEFIPSPPIFHIKPINILY